MAGGVTTEPRSGLKDMSDFVAGESGWADELVGNLRQIGRLAHPNLYVLDRDLTAPPGSPSDGDAYIPAATATGDWAGLEGQVVIYVVATPEWVAYPPKDGWLAVVQDEARLIRHDGTSWDEGVKLGGVKGVLDKAVSDANTTLTAAEAREEILQITGTLTAQRDVVVPLDAGKEWTVYNGTTGGFGIQIIGATGTGVVVGAGKRAIVYSDGTNVVRVTADT